MPLFDAKTLDNDFDGSALLASVLFPAPEAQAAARARGLARLASARSLGEAMSAGVGVSGDDAHSDVRTAPVA